MFKFIISMFVYRVEKSKLETEETRFVLFSLLLAASGTVSLFCTNQNVLTSKKRKGGMISFNLYSIFKAEIGFCRNSFGSENSVQQQQ